MSIHFSARFVVAAFAVYAVTVPVAHAQGLRPSRTREIATATFSAALATNGKRGTQPTGVNAPVVDARWLSDFRAGVSVRPIDTPVSWRFTGDAAARRVDSVPGFQLLGTSVGTAMYWPMNARTRLSSSAYAGYQPSYALSFGQGMYSDVVNAGNDLTLIPFSSMGLDPTTAAFNSVGINPSIGALPNEVVDFSVARSTSHLANASVGLSRSLTSRAWANVNVNVGGRDFLYERNRDTKYWNAAAHFSYRLTRMLNAHVGYGRRTIGYYEANGIRTDPVDDLDIGIDFNGSEGLPISITRRTKLTFTTGSSIVATNRGRQLRLTGRADLIRLIGNSGHIGLSYDRAVSAIDVFRRPVYTDAVVLGGTARFGRRVGLLLSAGYVHGQDSGNSLSDFQNYVGTVRTTVSLTRRARAYFEYLAYRNDINNFVDLPLFLTREELRQTVRAGFSMDVSLLRGERGRPVPVR